MTLDGAAVSRALQDESAALRTLVALLRDEQHALVYGEIEQIGLLAEPKAQSLFELSRLGAARLPETYTPEGSTVSFRAAHPRAVA